MVAGISNYRLYGYLNDSTRLVQLQMQDGLSLKDKQFGVMYGVYNGSKDEAVQKGYGRCNLIKGDYYYFSIGNNTSGLAFKKGDLIYILMDKTDIYFGQIPKLASHFIRLQNVYEEPLFDRYAIFNNWSEEDEKRIIDSMVADIKLPENILLRITHQLTSQLTAVITKARKHCM